MKNEKIFNAMEHLEDRFITEVMEQYGSGENIDLKEEYPVDPYAEGVVFNAESVNGKSKSRFVKWAGLAAGVCAVTAGAVIMGNNGLLGGNISMPRSTLLDNTQVSYTINVHDESVKYSLKMLKEKFDLEALNITDYRIKDVLKSGEAVVEGDKVYFKENDVNGNAVICAYDIVQNEMEILNVNRESEDSANFRPHCIYNGWLYYTEYGLRSEKICKINLDTKEIEVIAPKSTDSSLINQITFRDSTEGYLFFEEWTKEKTNETVTVKSYNMENGEIKTVKENAFVAMIHGDKLIYIDRSGNNDIKEIYFCNFDGSEEESMSDWIGSGLNVNHLSISARSDGEYIWEVSEPDSDSKEYGSNKRVLMRLAKEEGFTPITNLKIVGYYYERDDGYGFECSNGYLWWRNTAYDIKTSEVIKAGDYIEFCAIGSEVFCFDYSGFGTKVYRFNFDFPENNSSEDEPSKYNLETLKESFNAETVNTTYSIKEKLLKGLAVVRENKIYYAINDYTGNDLIICSYDTEKNEIETVSKDYFNNFEKISYDFIGIYSDSLYYRLYLGNYGSTSAADEGEYCIKRLDLSTGESETIYSYTTKPDDLLNKAVIIDNYLFFENTAAAAVYNIVRYDMESGNTVIFKENASAPASHKDKLIFCRKQDGNRAIYSCDLKSGENEEKLCDLSSSYVYPSVCSDGEKIWLSVLDTSSNDTFTVGYLDENNNFNQVFSSIKDYFPYEFEYANGYIVLHDLMIDVKSWEIISIENVAAVGNELYCGKYRTKYNQRMKLYQTELYLYHLQQPRL